MICFSPTQLPLKGGHVQGKQRRLTEERLPPYLSHKVWRKLLHELSTRNPPSRFDSSYFDTLKITKSCRSMLKGTLLFLDLMSNDGVPTPRLHQLVKSDGEAQKAALAEMIRSAYEPLFKDLDVTRATQAQIKEYFYSQGASGDIGRKCLSFFFAISTDANIPLSPHLRKSATRGRGKMSAISDVPKPRIAKSTDDGSGVEWERMLLEKFPNFNPEWSEDLKKKWFDAFKFLKKSLESSSPRRKASTYRRRA
jgi:Family of unknown function (DUF5343)